MDFEVPFYAVPSAAEISGYLRSLSFYLGLIQTVNNVKVEMCNFQKMLLKDSGHVPFDLSAIFPFLLPMRQR